jgi:tetratricopeptide (TPR) repeat protein
MSSQPTPPSKSPKSSDEPQIVSADGTPLPQPSFEERAQVFWMENKKTILLTCALVLAVLVGKELYFLYVDQREKAIGTEFAAAENNADKLRAFTAAHPQHQLAGLAWLALGDVAYKDGKFADAVAAYGKAVPLTKDTAFGGRALVGQAASQALAGDKTKAEAEFKAIADDATQFAAVRAEARYQLGAIAAEAGRTEEARKILDEVEVTDRTGVWSRRAAVLRAALPPAPAAAVAPAAATPTTEAEPKLSLPGSK